MLKTCQFCGKVYKTYYSNRMFCSYIVGYFIYKFTSLEFIQSESCQFFLMFLFFISFAVGFKICEIIKRNK